jgi:protoporphyrinogen oxidase
LRFEDMAAEYTFALTVRWKEGFLTRRTIGIIGGGPAGLALADELSRAGNRVLLFEADSELGGLARSFQFGDIRIERYYHFICGGDTGYFRKLEELGLGGALRWRPTKMGFFYRGRLYPFASVFDLLRFTGISLLGRLRYGWLALRCSLIERWRDLDDIQAQDWLVRALGEEAYLATWYPLLRIKFDRFHDQISAAWVWHRIHRVARSRKTPLHGERLGYLEGGTDLLVQAMESNLRRRGVEIHAGNGATRIAIEGGRARGVVGSDGTLHACDAVVSAVPLPVFVRLAPDLPDTYRLQLQSIDFIGVVCVALRLRQPLTPNFWLNINDERVPFNGCIEYSNLNSDATPDGSSILYVPFYLPRDHARFRQNDAQLIDEVTEALRIINPEFTPDWIIHASVSRDPFAQVICAAGFAARVPEHRTPIEDLYLIESSQLYPADRTISGTLDLAHNVAQLLMPDDKR